MPEEKDTSGEALARALELELAQKRLHWQRGREKYRTLRVLSFGFLFIIILAGLIAFFFFFSRTNGMRANNALNLRLPGNRPTNRRFSIGWQSLALAKDYAPLFESHCRIA